jgi:sugar lactone lactonase YvrE
MWCAMKGGRVKRKGIVRVAGIALVFGTVALAQQRGAAGTHQPGPAGGQAPATTAQEPTSAADWNAAAVKAYREKDYKRFLTDERKGLALEPENPRLIYNAACGEALNGNAKEAVALLDQLLARKLDLGAETDADFTGIRNTTEWAQFEAKLAELRKPVVRSTVGFKLEEPGLLAAGMAFEETTGDFYITSVRGRKIVRRAKDGKASDFVREGQDGFLAGAGLAIDGPRNLLYASTAGVPFMKGAQKDDDGHAGLFAFDLKTGKTMRKVWLPTDGQKHFLNNLAVGRAGNVYVSDSLNSGIYELRRDASTLDEIAPPTMFTGSQGLALSDDEKTLFVGDFGEGVWALDLATKAKRRIPAPADAYLVGLDGLAKVHDGFVTVQLQVQPARVVRLHMDRQWQRVVSVETLESNHPEYDAPIQGTLAEGAFWYVADSQLETLDPKTGKFPAEKAKATVVLRLPLAHGAKY